MKTKNMMQKKTKIAGFISAELGIGVLVVSILTLGGLLAAKSNEKEMDLAELRNEHTSIITKMDNVLAHNPNITDSESLTNIEYTFGIISDDIEEKTGVYIGIYESPAQTRNPYSIQYHLAGLDSEQCMHFVNWMATLNPSDITIGAESGQSAFKKNILNIDMVQRNCEKPGHSEQPFYFHPKGVMPEQEKPPVEEV